MVVVRQGFTEELRLELRLERWGITGKAEDNVPDPANRV